MICIANVGDWTACDFFSSVQCHKCDSLEVFLLRVAARLRSRLCWEFLIMFLFTFVFVWVGGGGKSLRCPRSPSGCYIACFSRFFQHRHCFSLPNVLSWRCSCFISEGMVCMGTECLESFFLSNWLWRILAVRREGVIGSWCCKSDHLLV